MSAVTEEYELDAAAAKALSAAGWFPERAVAIPAEFDNFCLNRNQSVPPQVRGVIANFDGIWLAYNRGEVVDQVHFDVGRVCRNLSEYILEHEYEIAAQSMLYPLAQTNYGLFFLISSDLHVFGGHSSYVGQYGGSVADFLNGLYENRRPTKIAD